MKFVNTQTCTRFENLFCNSHFGDHFCKHLKVLKMAKFWGVTKEFVIICLRFPIMNQSENHLCHKNGYEKMTLFSQELLQKAIELKKLSIEDLTLTRGEVIVDALIRRNLKLSNQQYQVLPSLFEIEGRPTVGEYPLNFWEWRASTTASSATEVVVKQENAVGRRDADAPEVLCGGFQDRQSTAFMLRFGKLPKVNCDPQENRRKLADEKSSFTALMAFVNITEAENGVPTRCADDSFIRRMVSFRKTERPLISFRRDVSFPKTRLKDFICLFSFQQIIQQIMFLLDVTYTFLYFCN
ncbi:hypothetical protein LXL04_016553 [Taraxacum kok-saghyz]